MVNAALKEYAIKNELSFSFHRPSGKLTHRATTFETAGLFHFKLCAFKVITDTINFCIKNLGLGPIGLFIRFIVMNELSVIKFPVTL